MQNNLTNKEYIKKLIIRSKKGEISQAESKEIQNNLANLSKEEWKGLKIIFKEIVKEKLDKKLDKLPENYLPGEWKNEVKNFLHSLVNFGFALVNEEMLYEAAQLAKGEINNLTPSQYQQLGEEMATKVFIPQLIIQLDKISARKPTREVKDYHKAEVEFVKKAKKTISLIKSVKVSEKMGFKVDYKRQLLKLLSIFKNTSADEIRVGKDKLKKYADWLIELKAGAEIKKHPELKQFMQSLMNFIDAVADEELYQEGLNLSVEIAENILHQIDEDEKDFKKGLEIVINEVKKPNVVRRIKSLLAKWTSHLNRLASEENDSISSQAQSNISQKISNIQAAGSQSDNNSSAGSQNFLNLLTNTPNNLVNHLGENPNSEDSQISWEDFFTKVEKDLTTVQSKGKWYKNPWFIGFSIVGAFAVGGLLVWLLTRRKKEKRSKAVHEW